MSELQVSRGGLGGDRGCDYLQMHRFVHTKKGNSVELHLSNFKV